MRDYDGVQSETVRCRCRERVKGTEKLQGVNCQSSFCSSTDWKVVRSFVCTGAANRNMNNEAKFLKAMKAMCVINYNFWIIQVRSHFILYLCNYCVVDEQIISKWTQWSSSLLQHLLTLQQHGLFTSMHDTVLFSFIPSFTFIIKTNILNFRAG